MLVSKDALEVSRSLKCSLIFYSPFSFDSFGYLSSFGELDGTFFNSFVVLNKRQLHHIIKYARSEAVKEKIDCLFIPYSISYEMDKIFEFGNVLVYVGKLHLVIVEFNMGTLLLL